MVNAWLLLSGIGMMLVGTLFPIYWWKTQKVPVKYFGYGAVLWILAIAPKIILDLTITPSMNSYLTAYGTEVLVIVSGIYVGLRTGLFESGFTYFAALKTKLKKVTYKQAFAFGLGFGGFEAFSLGAISFINIYAFVAIPELVNQVPAESQSILLQQLNQSTWVVPAAIMERIFIIFVHVFCSLLVFYSIRKAQKKYLYASIGYKTLVDAIIPALLVYIGTTTILSIYLMELPFVALGLFSILGIRWVHKQWSDNSHEKSNSNNQ